MTPPERPEVAAARNRLIHRLQAVAVKSPDYTVAGAPAGVWLDDIDALVEAVKASVAEPLRGALEDAADWLEAEADHPRQDPRPAMRRQAAQLRAALPSTPEPALDVERLGLSDQQTAILREHLASRHQTVTEFLGDVLMEYGLGEATGRKYPPPTTALTSEPRAAAPQEGEAE